MFDLKLGGGILLEPAARTYYLKIACVIYKRVACAHLSVAFFVFVWL